MRNEYEIVPELENDFQQETDYELLPEFEATAVAKRSNSMVYIQWVQKSLNALLNLRLSVDGIIGPMTRSAIRSFQTRQGLSADGIAGPVTEAAIKRALGTQEGTATPVAPNLQAGTNWTATTLDQRILYVMDRLINQYRLPVKGASGLVGNLIAESYLIPDRIEGSKWNTPMIAKNFKGLQTVFSALEVMNRNSHTGIGPLHPGIGLAQWTSSNRRTSLFNHPYQGRQLRELILLNMDAQLDYLIYELKNNYRGVYAVISDAGVSVNDATDEVVYRFEVPGSVLSKEKPRRLLPRNDPQVQRIFAIRRQNAQTANRVYTTASGANTGTTGLPQGIPVVAPTPPFTRPSGGNLRSNIVTIALQEWNKWGQGTKNEDDPLQQSILKGYWVVGSGSDAGYRLKAAWSGAFVSWVVKQAGGGSNFRYSGAHTTYTYAAKQNREQNKLSPFKAYRINEKRPEAGDIIVKNRGTSTFTYDNLQPGKSGTHGDIVVKVNANTIEVIGGNVSQSVSKKTFRLTPNGFLDSSLHFAIIKIEDTIQAQNNG